MPPRPEKESELLNELQRPLQADSSGHESLPLLSARAALHAAERERDERLELWQRTSQFQAVLSPDGTLLELNERTLQAVQRPADELLGRPVWEAPWWPEGGREAQEVRGAALRAGAGEFTQLGLQATGPDGQLVAVDLSFTPVRAPAPDTAGTPVWRVIVEGREVTGYVAAAREAQLARVALESLLENVQDGIVACDSAGNLTVFNRVSREMHGLGSAPVPPSEWSRYYDLYEVDGVTPLSQERIPLFRALQGEQVRDVEMVIAPRGLPRRIVRASGGPMLGPDGERLGAVVAMHDVTAQKHAEDRLRHDVLHDRLTGLPNRALLGSLLEKTMQRFERDPAHPYAVLFLDLDDFKNVNDAYGHLTGDRLLLETAARLKDAVRRTDTVARMGGDEFAVLLDAPCDEVNARRVAERLQRAMLRPFRLQREEVRITTSIGLATASRAYRRLEEPLRDADTAMYAAKRSGKNRTVLFEPHMHEQALARVDTERQLRVALREKQFALHYQPVMHLASGRCVGFEALLRWQHPQRGLLTPGAFLDVAERSGLIVPLGAWVLREAQRQLQEWQAAPELSGLFVSVNLSAQQLGVEAGTPGDLLTMTFPPGLHLEITEHSLADTPEALRAMRALHRRGVPLMLDDFGTGFASLSAAQRFPVGTLKIDRSFVSFLPGDARQTAIVASVVTLARHLELNVVAEGVETPEQARSAQALGCGFAQGFLFSRPVPAAAAAAFARAHPLGEDRPFGGRGT
ncbi:putative bifunctional diguanylate cyclase/phosphodiesterase [Deinococcus depolymerans]|uniref:EAL domain-containing protein n=1 Tax=Deinococcus depolymerans TaxID=392408 RepID=A0ABN1BPH7_9DEIO